MSGVLSTTLTPDAIAKFSMESMLGKANSKKPEPVDVPVYNKLKRSYAAHEKRKLQNARQLRNQMRQCRERVAQSLEALAAAESLEDLPDLEEDKWPGATLIPGFRYRANGDERKSLTDLRRLRLINSLTGLTTSSPKNSTDTRESLDNPEVTSMDNAAAAAASSFGPSTSRPSGTSSGENLTPGGPMTLTPEMTYMELRHPDLPTPGRPMTTYGYYKRSLADPEEEAAMRLRKVQEQLGLSNKQAGPRGRGGPRGPKDPAMSDAVQDLEHALKMLHLTFRNQDNDPACKFGGKGGSTKSSDRSLTAKDSRSSYSSKDSSFTRNRCQACLVPYKDDVTSLVKPSAAYRQPRWRFSPSGRYVDPPINALRICHPELFTQSHVGTLSLGSGKTSILEEEMFNADPFFPNLVDLSGAVERRASACSAAGSTPLVGTRAHTASTALAGNAVTGRAPARLFEEVVKLMGAANKPAPHLQGEPGESSAVDTENRFDDLKSRNEEKTLALQGKVRQFLQSLPPPQPAVVTAEAGPASSAATDQQEVQMVGEADEAFGECDYFLQPLT